MKTALFILHMKIFPVLIILFLSLNIKAQPNQKLTIHGILNENNPVRNAHCFLKNYNYVGTVTDSLGYFHMDLHPSLLKDTLVLSAIGYDQIEIPLSSIDLQEDTTRFFLQQKAIILDEVLVESRGDYLEKIFLNALANIPKNYPMKRHQLKGLYRKVSTEGMKHTHLQEAIITVEDRGYNKPFSSLKIRTEAFRESKELGKVDSFAINVYNKMNTTIAGRLNRPANPVYKLLMNNGLPSYKKSNSRFNYMYMSDKIKDYYTFELMDISVVDGDSIYQIALAESAIPPPPKTTSGRNYLKININDGAIVEMQSAWGFERKSLLGLTQLEFQKINGKYYLKYIKNIQGRFINREFDDKEYDIHTFSVDTVLTDDFKKIKYKEITDPFSLKSHKKNQNNEYWESSDLIDKYPLESAIKKDLEKHQPLEEQFQENLKN